MKLGLNSNIDTRQNSDNEIELLRKVIFDISSQYHISYNRSTDFNRELSIWHEIKMLRTNFYYDDDEFRR